MADGIHKGRIMTEIEGFGGVYHSSYSTSHRFEPPFQSGTISLMPIRSKAPPNLRIYPGDHANLLPVLMLRRVTALYNNSPVRELSHYDGA